MSHSGYASSAERAVLFGAAFPFLLLGAFYNYALTARLYLGYWPRYNSPDPKTLPFWLGHDLISAGFFCLPVVCIATVCILIVGRYRHRDFPIWTPIALLVSSVTAVLICCRMDPFGFV